MGNFLLGAIVILFGIFVGFIFGVLAGTVSLKRKGDSE
jgi:uncharacterized membrane protein SpoIIM required for sporulation